MNLTSKRSIVFLTGTRADFGKLKPLIKVLSQDEQFEVSVFVTGMHMLAKYGYTCIEVEVSGFKNIHKFINQNSSDSLDHILSKTIVGLSDYVKEMSPDLIVVHGDRVEALAGAAVGALNNILVGHIEGGEVSGTIDELIRHSVTKLSHIHFVCNDQAKARLIQLGELEEAIHIIGSPDIDIMNSENLPSLREVQERYTFDVEEYGILIFHPVTTELEELEDQISLVVDCVLESGLNYIVIFPNNDPGSDLILKQYHRLRNNKRFHIYPSMRFEFFLTLLKNARFIMGNSSAGIREAPHFGTPTINLGSRQRNRAVCPSILDLEIVTHDIRDALTKVLTTGRVRTSLFGGGDSATEFHRVLKDTAFWKTAIQKYFVDR